MFLRRRRFRTYRPGKGPFGWRMCTLIGLIFILIVIHYMKGSGDVVEGRTIIVDESGGGNYTTIDETIRYGTSNGDIIFIRSGNYTTDDIRFWNDNISIIGDSRETTNITFMNWNGLYLYSSHGTTIANLTFYFEPDDGDPDTYDRSLEFYIIDSHNVTIEGCSIHNAEVMLTGESENVEFSNNDLHDCSFRVANQLSEDPEYRLVRFFNTTANGYPIHHLMNVHDQEFSGRSGGYLIEGCTNLTFSNIELGNGSIGFFVLHSQHIILEESSINSTDYPLSVLYSSDIGLHSNSIAQGYLTLGHITNATVKNNIIDAYVFISAVNQCSFIDNQLSSYGYLHTYLCENLTLRNNSFDQGGMSYSLNSGKFSGFDPDSTIIEGNRINGKPLYYYYNEDNETVPEDAGQVIMIQCSDMIISKVELSTAWSGIIVVGSSRISILGSSFHDVRNPLQTLDSKDILFENCTVDNSSYGSVSLVFTNRSVIHDSQFQNARLSIHGEGITVLGCSFTSTDPDVWSGIDTNGNSSIEECSISGYDTGIYIRGDNVCISGSSITNNSIGVSVGGSNCTIVNCWIIQNSEYGVELGEELQESGNVTADARYNYWGAVNGPYHATDNPSGWGDEVSDGVVVSPWHTSHDFEPYCGDDGGGTGDGEPFILVLLLVVLIALFGTLVIAVVRE